MGSQKAGEKTSKGLSTIPSEAPGDTSSKMNTVIEEFRRERDSRDALERETTSWKLKVLLPCLIFAAALDLADLLGYARIPER